MYVLIIFLLLRYINFNFIMFTSQDTLYRTWKVINRHTYRNLHLNTVKYLHLDCVYLLSHNYICHSIHVFNGSPSVSFYGPINLDAILRETVLFLIPIKLFIFSFVWFCCWNYKKCFGCFELSFSVVLYLILV